MEDGEGSGDDDWMDVLDVNGDGVLDEDELSSGDEGFLPIDEDEIIDVDLDIEIPQDGDFLPIDEGDVPSSEDEIDIFFDLPVEEEDMANGN